MTQDGRLVGETTRATIERGAPLFFALSFLNLLAEKDLSRKKITDLSEKNETGYIFRMKNPMA